MAKPNKCISVEEAKVLHDNWVGSRAPVIQQSRRGREDCREFVYSVAELQEFLDYVRDESQKQGIDNPGVRIYFGAYTGESGDQATIFLSPTDGGGSNSGNNYNLEPFNFGQGGDPPTNYNP